MKKFAILASVIGLLIMYFKWALTIAVIDVIFGTTYFSWINALYALIVELVWRVSNHD